MEASFTRLRVDGLVGNRRRYRALLRLSGPLKANRAQKRMYVVASTGVPGFMALLAE